MVSWKVLARKIFLSKGMGYCKKDIEGYLEVIRETRKYE